MKKHLIILALGVTAVLPAKAQWNAWNTSSAISGVLGIAGSAIESAERKKAMEIQAREKAEYEQSFKDAMETARGFEESEKWEDALAKYEEAANLNCNYGYTDQQQISRKITELYVKAGRTEEGPSILNNAKVTLADYSNYRYVRENPVYVNKKATNTKLVRVCCSDTETRLELEVESSGVNTGWSVKGKAYIKGNKGGKQQLVGVENITMAPASTKIPWPFQKLRFALIFPPLPDNATEFNFIEPSSTWQFKDIKCK